MGFVENTGIKRKRGRKDDGNTARGSKTKIRRNLPDTTGWSGERSPLWPPGGLPSERIESKGPYNLPIIELPPGDNLCLFSSCLNGLGTRQEQVAFCCGNIADPAAAFKAMSTQIKNNGYSGQHILAYLKHLQLKGYIRSFVWKMSDHFKWPNIVLTKPHPVGTCLVICGTSSTQELMNEVERKLKVVEFKPIKDGPDVKTVCSKTSGYKKNSKKVTGKLWKRDCKAFTCKAMPLTNDVTRKDKYHTKACLKHSHAVSVRFVPWYHSHPATLDGGTPVIFDNRWKDSRQGTADNLATVYNVLRIYTFSITV